MEAEKHRPVFRFLDSRIDRISIQIAFKGNMGILKRVAISGLT